VSSLGRTAGPALHLRPASVDDLQFVAQVYGRAMGEILRRAGLDVAQQAELLAAQWNPAEIRIIGAAGRQVGWVQVADAADAVFIRNFCVDPDWQRLGIGSAVLRMLIAEAAHRGTALSLGVAKGNPARHLYERHGFRVTHDDAEHHYMRREASPSGR